MEIRSDAQLKRMFEANYNNRLKDFTTSSLNDHIYKCDKCGALVEDFMLHSEWHEINGED